MDELLATVAAKDAIRELTARYCRHAMDADGAALAALFVEDGWLDSSGTVVKGRAELARYIDGLGPRTVIPLIQNHVITVDGAQARGWCVVVSPVGVPALGGFVAQYDDSYQCEGGEWRFVGRTIEILYSHGRAHPPAG
jgi:hypothetical protein